MIVDIKKNPLKLSISNEIKKTLIVCSHERSGTHFLMNSISANSIYTVDPYLNFDLIPIGDIVNFYSPKSVEDFLHNISLVNYNGQNYKLASIVKSHHPSSTFKNLFNNPNFIFIYIYRKPIDVLISYRNLIEEFKWHEGQKKKLYLNL